jgi:hypothetical protein
MDYDSNPEKGETAVAKLWPILTFPNYEKITLHFATLLLIGGSALADSYRVTIRSPESGRDNRSNRIKRRSTAHGHGDVPRRSGDGRQPRQAITFR